MTPINGSRDVPLEGKWKVGPYTPYGDEPDSYYYDQQIQIRFVYSVDPASVNSGVTITTEGGKKLEGTWTPSEHNALYTFECDGLAAGTIYNINITSGVKSENGTALAEERTVSFKTEGTYLVEAVADTYVSSAEPDRAFGTAGTLKASGIYTTLVSFEAANVIEAEKVILRADTASDSPLSVNVYALADTLVDSTITYNTLIATDAWANKTLIGEYTIGDGTLSLDLSELADLQLGRYVTLAFESNEEIAEGHKYFNDFETPPLGTAIMNGDIPVVDENGRVTDARYYNKNGQSITPWTINKPSSPYIWARSGTRSEGYLLTDTSISSSRVFRVTTWQGEGQHMKFFNTTTDGYLTANDVGKTFRVTFDIYPTRDMTLSVGFSPAVAGDGSPESPKVPNNDATIIYGSRYVQDLSANQWTTITCDITLTQYLVDMQAGLVTAQLKYPASTDSVRDVYTYFDNLRVEELTPSFEAENGAFSLITTKRGVALNQPITVTFDEAMDLSAVAEDVIVRNEKTGNRVSGEWIAASEDGKSFAFVTKGLEPATTYTVTMADELIRTVVTEGTYAIRPIATSYVSISEPQRHFGLDATPILSSDKLGVVTFSAKTLKTAGIATLYLDVETETNTYLNVYAIADYTPDSTLCYNTVESKLAGAALLESRNAENGKLAIDLSALAGRTLGENVTLILKAGYRFFNDFETPILNGSATPSKAGQVENVPENVSYSDAYIWASAGYTTSGYHINAKGNDSQNLRISTQQYNGHPTGIQHTMFYNTLKVGERMNAGDVGRTYKVSLRLRASVSTDTPLSGQVDPIQLLTGYTTRMTETYNGSTYKAETWLDTPDSRSSVTLTIGDTSWTDCNFTVTVNEVMAGVQGGMLTFQIPGVKYSTTSNGSTVYAKIHTFYDDILVEEIIDEDRAITLPVADFIVMTENTGAVEITAADKPVKDEVVQETPETPDVPDTPIPVGPDASIVSYQVTKGEDGSFDIRLIAGVDSLKYINFGYEITLTTAEGTQMITGETDKVYTSIYGGNIPYSIKKQFGYKYAALATVTGLATDSSSTELTIAAYVTTDAGEKIYGEGATLRYVGTVDSEGYPEFSLVD